MPVSIGDVHSEVLVDSPPAEGQGAEGKQQLPSTRELERWLQLQRRQHWDEQRTRAHDFDD